MTDFNSTTKDAATAAAAPTILLHDDDEEERNPQILIETLEDTELNSLSPPKGTIQSFTLVECKMVHNNNNNNEEDAAEAAGSSSDVVVDTSSSKEGGEGRGMVYITDSQLQLFMQHSQQFIKIDPECINLHAQSEDGFSIFAQLSPSSSSEGMELTFKLASTQDCQSLFDALCNLVSKYPVAVDDDDDDAGMMMMGDATDGDMMMADAPPATEDQRQAMLSHLDNLLVTKDHTNGGGGVEGQFDDADL